MTESTWVYRIAPGGHAMQTDGWCVVPEPTALEPHPSPVRYFSSKADASQYRDLCNKGLAERRSQPDGA